MKQAKILTKDEYKRVMNVIDAHRHSVRNKTIFALSFYAGVRACEIAGLKVGDVFSEEGNVRDTMYLESEQTKGNEKLPWTMRFLLGDFPGFVVLGVIRRNGCFQSLTSLSPLRFFRASTSRIVTSHGRRFW